LFSELVRPLETVFHSNDGRINIDIREGRFLDQDIIRKQTSVIEHDYTYAQGYTYIAAHGKANTTYVASDVKTIDFSSYERQVDFSSVAGNNEAYLVSPSKAELKKELEEAKEFLKIKIEDPFSFIRAGDYFRYNLKLYTVKQIQEVLQAGNANTYDFEIEERVEH